MKKYYFLDGIEKKGPYVKDDFIALNLHCNTLIWTEGLDNWKPLKDFPDLLKVIPPPLPEDIKSKNFKKRKKKKFSYSFIALFLFLGLSFIITYSIIESRKAKYEQELTNRIGFIFNGKSTVCDGVQYGVKEKKISINYRDKQDGIIEKFDCTEGGFTFQKLKKIDSGFELEILKSTNMAYTSNNYWRGTVQEAYNSAYKYILENNSGCYSSSSYELIVNFKYLNNDYYYLENKDKPSSNLSHWWTTSDEYVYNNYRRVYYEREGWYYEISEREWKIQEDYVQLSSFAGCISIFLFILLITINPFKW
jgi:hypothetical protein